MSLMTAVSLPFPTWDCQVCTRGKGICNGEVEVITTSCAREIFIRCAPIELPGCSEKQAMKFYSCLPRLLDEAGADMSHVVFERVFFRDIVQDYHLFRRVRLDAYRQAGVPEDQLPAASYLEEPPCRPVQAFELQVYAVVPNGKDPVRVETYPAADGDGYAKVVEMGGYRHLYIMSVTGEDSSGWISHNFREQSDALFDKLGGVLGRHGVPFTKVLRTWCYLDDIDRDYAEFNLSRNAFFKREGVRRLPASTGIRSGLYPPGTYCKIDAYALVNPEGTHVEVMHTPTLNEAPIYGSSFSRGMKLELPEKTVLFISGTASVDEQGATVHIGDVRRQIERMLVNIRELLRPHGATFADVVQAITYLKSADDLDLMLEIGEEWGLTGIPNTIVEAGVCRPNLLCEMEAIAVLLPDEIERTPDEALSSDIE